MAVMVLYVYGLWMETAGKLSERRVALTMPASEVEALDAYCAVLRRSTGEPAERAGIIRRAIKQLIQTSPDPRSTWAARQAKP